MAGLATLALLDLVSAADMHGDPHHPETWTIRDDGRPLTQTEVALVRNATPSDWQLLHDMTVADAKALGLPSPCEHDH